MDDGDGGGSFRLGKKKTDAGEVDYKTKAGTAWSHNFLNQKPWHPLSYPNQRRKWIAEQTHASRERRAEEVAREFAQEQEFFRQTALFSKKEKEKVEMMKAVSFMYVRPPGYNAESAKAAEVADERKNLDQNNAGQDVTSAAPVTDTKPDKKTRPKDVFGRPLPTEEEFEVLKNAPRLETGMPARVKPFGIEIRNVRCVRCGTFGHQSGDRECPLKDTIMPNDENRLKRDDPLTAILAQTDSSEPLKWELKQKPGMSPPRGGFQPDDPNQQIVAEEIFDEYGGFLSGGDIPALVANFSTKKSKKHSKHKSRHKQQSASASHDEPKHRPRDRSPSYADSEDDGQRKRGKSKYKKKKRCHSESSRSDSSDLESYQGQSSSDSEDGRERKRRPRSKNKKKKQCHSESSRSDGPDVGRHGYSSSSSESEDDRERKQRAKKKHDKKKSYQFESNRSYSSDSEHRGVQSFDSEDDRGRKRAKNENKKTKRYHVEMGRSNMADSEHQRNRYSFDSEVERERKRRGKGRHKERDSRNFDCTDSYRHHRGKRH